MGVGLFCQASRGADGLHGTAMGTKTKKKLKMAFLKSVRRGGSEKRSFAPFLTKKLQTIFATKNGQNQEPQQKSPPPPPLSSPWGCGGPHDPSPPWGNLPPA